MHSYMYLKEAILLALMLIVNCFLDFGGRIRKGKIQKGRLKADYFQTASS